MHPQSEVFDIEIVTSNLSQPTLFILDNLNYKAELCDGSSKQVRQVIVRFNVCFIIQLDGKNADKIGSPQTINERRSGNLSDLWRRQIPALTDLHAEGALLLSNVCFYLQTFRPS